MNDDLAARAELYLCLSQAFLAPATAQRAHAVRAFLADDLQDLDDRLALQAEGALADFREQLQRVDADLALLQIYSAIFLAPPVAALVNAGQYLDGAPDGGSVRVLEEAYRRCGMGRDEDFRDLADHVSVVLEFVAWLYAQQADGQAVAIEPGPFLHACVAPWVQRFAADVARAAGAKALPANPYRGLAAILQIAVLRDLVAPEVDQQALRHERALQRARAMRASRGITAEDLDEIRQKLRARGLSADHLPTSVQEADRRVAAALGAA